MNYLKVLRRRINSFIIIEMNFLYVMCIEIRIYRCPFKLKYISNNLISVMNVPEMSGWGISLESMSGVAT